MSSGSSFLFGPRNPGGPSPQNPSRIGSPAENGVPGNPQQNPVFPSPRSSRRWLRWMSSNPEGAQISIIFDPNAYAWLRGELIVDLPTAGGPVLLINEANTYRNFLQLRNSSTTPASDIVFISFGKEASIASMLRLGENDAAGYTYGCPQDAVWGFGINADLATPSTTARVSLAFSNAAPFTGPEF